VLPRVGHYGRAPIHIDALEAALVAGKWKPPRAGDTVTGPDGARAWAAARAGKDGALEHEALRGGYAYWKVHADAPRVALLEASGHLTAYVNGEPRAGDPYANGILRLPVSLRAGDNDLLFHCGRGRLQARLTTPASPALLDTRDLTAPDFLPGEGRPPWAALVVLNAGTGPLEHLAVRARTAGAGTELVTPVASLPPLSTRNVAFRVPPPPAGAGGDVPVEVALVAGEGGKARVLDTAKVALQRRGPAQSYKRTFVSGIDGSVQYYAVQPARPAAHDAAGPALVLTLHGAGVEATGQADAYAGKAWAHIVAPTNRRPFGFDWEDWGRLDALEVLEHARRELKTDPARTYLTGHSMGGHGVWHLGATFPDRWAAIAPSAGWVSFWSYVGAFRPDKPTPAEALLLRAVAPGDTLTLLRNCAAHGVYVLHGEDDDNVPVKQARLMREQLGTFHPDFAYYERPGAGHWWGSECVDWPPLFDFLARHRLPRPAEVRRVDFTTASPGVSDRCHWLVIEAQEHALQPSSARVRLDPARRRFEGTTDNVARLALDLEGLGPGKPLAVEMDGQKMEDLPWPATGARVTLRHTAGKWSAAGPAPAAEKGPHRYGPFKEVFTNGVRFVYGTRGTPEENAWAFAKARFDAETFWYRGNAAVEVVPDTAFDPDRERDRNVVLYGHAQGNGAWEALLSGSPVQVRRGKVRVGERRLAGDDLGCLFVRPRPGSDLALVGVVGGTGPAGLRLTDRLAYFVSGCGYPDCLVLGPEALTRGTAGVRGVGFFGNDWGVSSGEFVWPEAP
jgi:hypothetical protein